MGCLFKARFRCICLILWVECLGRGGRNVIKSFVLVLIITGPIENIITNSREVVTTFSCSTRLTYNLSKTRFELMAKPFHNALTGMSQNVSEMKNKFGKVQDVLEPIKIEVEDEDDDNANSTKILEQPSSTE